MFPEQFAIDKIGAYSNVGDWVLDPFSGRGTTAFQAALMDRVAVALDINPVAYVVTAAKLKPPTYSQIDERLRALEDHFGESLLAWREERRKQGPFLRRAYYYTTLEQILFLRAALDWRVSDVDRFIAALLLGTLHGESKRSHRYLSNQMMRTISPKPAYALRWWRERGLYPPKRDVFARLREECRFRIGTSDVPHVAKGRKSIVAHGDARQADQLLSEACGKVGLVVTSPPYLDTTRFEEDQWLRLWALGFDDRPTYGAVSGDDRIRSAAPYWRFLSQAWRGIRALTVPGAVVCVRIGGKAVEADEWERNLTASLRESYASVEALEAVSVSLLRKRQTDAFRPGSVGNRFELDFTFKVA